MLALLRKGNSEENSVKLVAYTIILFISSAFVPFVIVASFQSMVYYSRSQWFFATPFSAYIAFMGGMLYIAVLLTIFLIFKQKWEGAAFKWTIILLILVSLPVFILSLTNYYYVDDKGIYYNQLTSLKEDEFRWEEMKTVQIVYRNHQGTTSYYQYKFKLNDGREVTLPYNEKFGENRRRVNAKIEQNQIKVNDNFDNPIKD